MERNENDAIPEDNPKSWCSLAQCFENMFHYCLARSFYNNVEIYLQDLYKVAHDFISGGVLINRINRPD